MKKTTRTARKVLSVFLAVLMMLTTWAVAVPGLALAADYYYVRVYLNIYDGANSDGYGKAYTVVDDINSEFYGKPDDYKWDYGSSWSATDNSDGYDGEVNMAGFTLFYDNDKKFETYDLASDLVTATTTLGNNWTSMDDLTLENFASWPNKVEKVYSFELDSLPSSLFWVNDENNAVNGETSFGFHKITVAESSTSQEHILWTGLSGSESYYECYYGTITPTGIITPWDDCPGEATKSFYKDYTTSAIGTWIDPYRESGFNMYPVNNYVSGGVSMAVTIAEPGATTNVDYVDVTNTNNYYVNFLNHSTQTATVTVPYNSYILSGYNGAFTIAPGESRSMAIDKTQIVQGSDGFGFADLSFKYTLSDVYESDGTTLVTFSQPAGIATLVGGEKNDAESFQLDNFGDFYLTFQANKGYFNSEIFNNNTGAVSFDIDYYFESAGVNTWEDIAFRLKMTEDNYRRINFQNPSYSPGSLKIGGDIGNSNSVSLRFADFVFDSYEGKAYNFNSEGGFAYYGTTYTPTWVDKSSDSYATLYNDKTAWMRFTGTAFKGAYSENPGTITFTNMKFRDSGGYTATFSGSINVYAFDKSDLREYLYNIGDLGSNWAPMSARYSETQWNNYKNAYLEAVKVLGNGTTNQKAVTDAYNALYNATEALKDSANLTNQIAEVTYTKRTTDYDSAVVSGKELSKYLLMPIGTETAVPAYDTYKYATSGTVVGKQSSNLKTNFTEYDTGINPIDYRYWKIDFAGVDKAVEKATALLDSPLDTYSDAYYEALYDARTAVSYFDRDADTWTPTHQSDVSAPLAELNALLTHDSTDAAVHDFYDDVRNDAENHWYECEVCGYKLTYSHSFAYTEKDSNVHTVTCTTNNTQTGCGYTFEEEHKWVAGDIVSTPDCNNDGSRAYTCSDCGAEKTETITSEGHKYVIADLGDGTHGEKCSVCQNLNPDVTVEAHTNAYLNNNDGTHTVTCSVCNATETVDHTFVNPVLTRPTQNADGTWVDGTYTSYCVCGAEKVEPAERADYSELDEIVEALKGLQDNENLTDEAKKAITDAIAKDDALADDLVTAEQGDIDALVKELNEIKADADEAIKNKELGVNNITEATSGVKVQFIDKSGLGTIENIQLGKDDAFKIRVANGNADRNITITSIQGEGIDKTGATLTPGESAIYDVTAPTEAGIKEYTITYTIDGLKDAEGDPVEATTKAYLYVKAAAFTPYHLMDETCNNGPATAKWEYSLEASVGDFAPVYNNKAPKAEFGNDNLVVDKDWVRPVYHKYDYEDKNCFAECTGTGDTPYVKGDAHAATYRYYIDTSLAPTWQEAGFKAVIAEGVESKYDYAVFDYIRLANNKVYLDSIQGDDKTFSVTVIPGASSNVPTKTWTATSTGDEALTVFDTSDVTDFFKKTEYLFGNYLDEAQTTYTAYTNFSGSIPQKTESANMMFSYRIGYNMAEDHFLGGVQAESTTMTTHLYITSYDKAALRDAVTAAETAGYNSAYFDEATYEAYETALKNAKEVLGKAETNQAEIDGAVKALNTAVANLTADGSEVMFVLTVTHSIHENADKNSTATETLYDYYLVNGDVTPDYTDLTGKTINKYDDKATINVTEDKTHTYNYWYIDYSGVQGAIDAADAIINDTENGYSEKYKQQAEDAKTALEAIKNGEKTTTTPDSQSTVDAAIEAVTRLTHTCDQDVEIPAQEATCDATGLTVGAKCSVCGKVTKAQESTPKAEHAWSVSYAWSADYSTCTATRNCANFESHAETAKAIVSSEVTDKATCEGNGTTTYTATFDVSWAETKKESVKDIPATNHSWTVTYTWGADNATCTATRTCANDASHNVNAYATVTYNKTTPATCEGEGEGEYTADFTSEWAVDQTKKVTLAPIDHNYDIANAKLVARPELVDGTWTTGKYEASCLNDDTHKLSIEGVERADYTEFDAAVAELKELAKYENFTDEVKTAILDYATKLENGTLDSNNDGTPDVLNNYVKDYIYDGVTIKGEQELLDAFVIELTKEGGVIDQIEANKEKPEFIKPDFSAYDEEVKKYTDYTSKENILAEDKKAVEDAMAVVDAIEADTNATAADNNATISAQTAIIKAINDKYAVCVAGTHDYADATCTDAKTCKLCGTTEGTANGHDWSEWELTLAPTKDAEGTYTRTCSVGDATETKSVAREDYTAYDAAVERAEGMLTNTTLTEAAKNEIREAITEAKKLDQNLPADVVEDGETIIDNDNDKVIEAATNALTAVLDKINNDTTGAYEKVDYTAYNAAVDAYEALDEVMTDADKAAVEAIKAEIAEIPADGTKKDYQVQVDKAAADIAAINAKYGDCADGNHNWGAPELTKKPTADTQGEYTETCGICGATQITKVDLADYDAFNEAVNALQKLAKTENLTTEAKTAINEALAKAEALDKNLPADVTTVDGKKIEGGQDKIDALVAELNGVVADTNADIADGSALKPDYKAWKEAEEAYDALDKTNVKNEIITEAETLKTKIADKQVDDTLTQATATQAEINAATTRLNEIIAGINDGSLKDPDYSAVEEKLTEANNATGLNKDTQDKIDAIEEALEEIQGRTEPEANYRDNQSEVDALESQLNEILSDIADNSAKAPDYSNWDAAERTYDALDKTNVPAEFVTEATELQATIDALKADNTANVVDDQQTIDEATTELNEIIAEINGILTEKPDFTDFDASHDAYEKLIEQYGDKIKDGVADDVAALDTIVEGVRNDETATKVEDQTTIDNAKTQLDAIIAGIENGTLIKDADFTDADADLADAKTKAENNNVIAGVKDAINDIEADLNELRNDPTTNANDQDDIDALEKQLEDIIAGIEDGTLVKPDFTNADADLADAKNKAENNDVIDGVKEDIKGIEDELNEIRNDGTATKSDDQDDVDALEKELEGIIAGIEDGSLVKPNYTDAETAIKNAENTDSLTDADKEALEDLKEALGAIKNDPTSNKKDDQTAVDVIKEAVQDIVDKYADCENGNHNWGAPELTKKPTADAQGEYTETCGTCGATQITNVDLADYDAFDEAVKALQDLAKTENLTAEAAKAITDALAKAEALDKNLPADVTTADGKEIKGGQDKIDALVAELTGVVADTKADIADGSALKPNYNAWEDAEGKYDALDKTNVKAEVIDRVNELKAEIADKQKDDTLTQATATQKDIDDATAELNAIIAGIKDGSLRDPDYADVENKLEDANNAENLNKDTQDKIDAIEKELAEIKGKTEPEANAKDDQAKVDALEDRLDEILKDIENGTATAPDYSKWNAAEGSYNKFTEDELANVDAETLNEVTELKNTINDLKVDPTANAKDDQKTIDDAIDRLNEIIKEINSTLTEKPDFNGYDDAHDEYEDLVKQYGDKIKDGVAADVADLDEIVDGVRDDETATKIDDQKTIDDAKAELEEIIEGIKDGSLRDPDYSAAEKDLADAKDKADKNDVTDGVKKDIKDIEDKLNEIKNDPTTNANDQKEIDALEKELEDIITGIENGTLVKPDFSGYDESHDDYEELVGQYGDKIKDSVADDVAALDTIVEGVRNDETATKADDQLTVDNAKTDLDKIIEGIIDGTLRDPDYTEINKDLADAKDKAENNNVADGVKDQINKIEDKLNELENDPTTNANDQPAVDALEKELEDIIAGIEDGTLVKPDFSGYDETHDDYEELVGQYGDKIKDSVADDVAALDTIVEGVRNDETATKADDQPTVDNAKTDLDKIIKGIIDGTLRDPDYTEINKDLADAKDKADKNDVTDGVKEDIKEIEDKLNEFKEDPTTNANDQNKIDALEKELEDIIKGIEEGTFAKPDYTDWEAAEKAYDALGKTNVKPEIIKEATALKSEIAKKQADDTLTQATATQKDINDATTRLNEIISGITDGSLKDPDYTGVDDKLDDLKDEKNLTDATVDKIDEIEKAIDELKKDESTNAKENQDDVDNLEKELNEIIAGITDGSLVKPDYTEADKAIADADKVIKDAESIEGKLDITLTEEEKAALDELKAELEAIKNDLNKIKKDPTSNKKDDQAAVDALEKKADEIASGIKEVTNKYAECLKGNHKHSTEGTVVAPTCTEQGYTQYTCEICGKIFKTDFVNATGHLDENDDGTCDKCGATDIYEGCACLCHNNHWFWRIVYMIIRIIWKVFKMHQVCPCGRLHY